MVRPSVGNAVRRSWTCSARRRRFVRVSATTTHVAMTEGCHARSVAMRTARRRRRSIVATRSFASTMSVFSSITTRRSRRGVPREHVDHPSLSEDRERHLVRAIPAARLPKHARDRFVHGGVTGVERPSEVARRRPRDDVNPAAERLEDGADAPQPDEVAPPGFDHRHVLAGGRPRPEPGPPDEAACRRATLEPRRRAGRRASAQCVERRLSRAQPGPGCSLGR